MNHTVQNIKDPLLSSVYAIFDLSQIKIPQTPEGGGIRSSDMYRRVGMAIMGFWSDSQLAHARLLFVSHLRESLNRLEVQSQAESLVLQV